MLESFYTDVSGGGRPPRVLREDFCGTFANCCAWVKRGSDREAHAVDLDREPLAYGEKHNLAKLADSDRARVKIHQSNVLGEEMPSADIIAALNFSYFIFKERAVLKRYFENCRRTLNDDGVLILDCFGGTACTEANEEETIYKEEGFSYYWDQESFDPLTNEAEFAIHFKVGDTMYEHQFNYDWRMWSPRELKDLLLECGYTKVAFYWEGTDEEGAGDGEFSPVEKGEECESWVTYIVARR
jgi:SAM-dependent methyltransferase